MPGNNIEKREIREETSLKVTLLDGFRAVDEHTLAREGHPERIKQTVYFLARFDNREFRPQESEISKIVLKDYDSAMSLLQLDSFKRILSEANTFLLNNDKSWR